MKALVTGAGGFVGPHLCQHLQESGDDVLAFDSNNGPDLRNADAWIELLRELKPEVVYHLGGWSDVGGSWNHPTETYEVNVMGVAAVLEAARRIGSCRVIVVSSADVYGLVTQQDLPIAETQPPRPRSPYGGSKLAAETVVAQYRHGFDLDVLVARPFNHLGPGQSPSFAAPAFARQIAMAELATEPTTLRHGDLRAERDITDVRDVVRAYRLLADRGEAGETYNICSGRTTSMQHLLNTLLSLSEADIVPEQDEDRMRPIDLPVLQGSSAKLSRTTGWSPTISLSQTLGDVLADARCQITNTLESSP